MDVVNNSGPSGPGQFYRTARGRKVVKANRQIAARGSGHSLDRLWNGGGAAEVSRDLLQ